MRGARSRLTASSSRTFPHGTSVWRVGELLLPECAQAELFPGVAVSPAIAEAAGLFDREGGELDLDHVLGGRGGGGFAVGEELTLVARAVLVQHVEGVLPGVVLRGVEFAEVEQLALHSAAAMHA